MSCSSQLKAPLLAKLSYRQVFKCCTHFIFQRDWRAPALYVKWQFSTISYGSCTVNGCLTLLFCWSWLACTDTEHLYPKLFTFEWSPPVRLENYARATSGKSHIDICYSLRRVWRVSCTIHQGIINKNSNKQYMTILGKNRNEYIGIDTTIWTKLHDFSAINQPISMGVTRTICKL